MLSEEEAAGLKARLGQPKRVLGQDSFFFDTAADDLARAGVSLRVREERKEPDGSPSIKLTVKEAGKRAGALMVRPETESRLTPGLWEVLRAGRKHFDELKNRPVSHLRNVLADFAKMQLGVIGSFTNRRDVYSLRVGRRVLEVLIDKTRYPDGSEEIELECELPQSAAGQASRALRDLFGELEIEWRPSKEGKYLRFRRKIGRYVGPPSGTET